MTQLTKAVSRRTDALYNGRQIVVTLIPSANGAQLALRLARDRMANAYRATIDDIFRRLAETHAQKELARKKKERELRRKQRLGLV